MIPSDLIHFLTDVTSVFQQCDLVHVCVCSFVLLFVLKVTVSMMMIAQSQESDDTPHSTYTVFSQVEREKTRLEREREKYLDREAR